MLQKLTHDVINSLLYRAQSPADFNVSHTTACLLQAGVGLSIKNNW